MENINNKETTRLLVSSQNVFLLGTRGWVPGLNQSLGWNETNQTRLTEDAHQNSSETAPDFFFFPPAVEYRQKNNSLLIKVILSSTKLFVNG
jgi:hypothetical protein